MVGLHFGIGGMSQKASPGKGLELVSAASVIRVVVGENNVG
jgi:hypothetical protein